MLTFTSDRTSYHLDVPYKAIKDPLLLKFTREIQTLQLLLVTQYQILSAHHQQAAVETLRDFLLDTIMHRLCVGRVELVQHDTFGQLYGQPMSIDGDFMDQITALDSHFLARYEMLDDSVGKYT